MKPTMHKKSFIVCSVIVPTILLIGCGQPESDIWQLQRAAQKATSLDELDKLGHPNAKSLSERTVLLGRRVQLAAHCAIEQMSTEAKTALAEREHEKRMRSIGYDSLLYSEIESVGSEWYSEIIRPLLRSCDEQSFLYEGVAMNRGQEAVRFMILQDKEYREIMAPLDSEYREAKDRHEAMMKEKKQKEDAERQQREAWLFKKPSSN